MAAAAAAGSAMQRIAAGLGGRRAAALVGLRIRTGPLHANPLPPQQQQQRQLRSAASLRCLPALQASSCAAAAAAAAAGTRRPLLLPTRLQQQQQRRRRQQLAPLAASYTVVTDGEDPNSSSSGSSSSGFDGQPWKLIIYSKDGCHLCDGLKEKVEAVLERAAFMPSAFSTAELEVRDITSNPEWEQQYAMTIPVLAAAAADGSSEVAVPRPPPRLSADALQKHIEKFLAKQQQQQQEQQQ